MNDECPVCIEYAQQVIELERNLDAAIDTLSDAQDKLNDITNLVMDLYRLVK